MLCSSFDTMYRPYLDIGIIQVQINFEGPFSAVSTKLFLSNTMYRSQLRRDLSPRAVQSLNFIRSLLFMNAQMKSKGRRSLPRNRLRKRRKAGKPARRARCRPRPPRGRARRAEKLLHLQLMSSSERGRSLSEDTAGKSSMRRGLQF